MISFIYFDVGGVAMLDFSGTNKWEELKKEMGVNEDNNAAWEHVWSRYKNKVCLDCDVDSLVPIFTTEVGLNLPPDYSLLDNFIKRFTVNMSIWPVVDAVAKKYRIGLLTNMYPRMLSALFEQKLIPPKETWEIILDSSEIGFQKPDKRLYEIAQQVSGVKNEEILFIENSAEHLQAAQDFGWQTFAYDSQTPNESSRELMNFLNKNNF
ncbi:MAG: HAD-IA family hydrolase [Microgenomates group bacterium]